MTRPKDHPETDPNVKALGGFDVTRLSVDALSKAGVILGGGIVLAERGEHRAWKTHSEFLADDRPAWDVMDRAYARAITAAHVRHVRRLLSDPDQADTLAELRVQPFKGMRLPRSFPCLGMLRVLSEHGRLVIVQCDVCGEEVGLQTPPDPRDEDERPKRHRRRVDHSETTPGGW